MTSETASLGNRLFLIDSASHLNRIVTTSDGPADAEVIALPDSKRAIAAATGAHRENATSTRVWRHLSLINQFISRLCVGAAPKLLRRSATRRSKSDIAFSGRRRSAIRRSKLGRIGAESSAERKSVR